MIKNINAATVLKNLWISFGHIKMPGRIVTKCNYDDKERKQIEAHFSGMNREEMTSYDVSMMLIDGALIEPKAFLYFLPRLTEDVINADADIHFLSARMEDLLEINGLTDDQKSALEQLKILLDNIEFRLED